MTCRIKDIVTDENEARVNKAFDKAKQYQEDLKSAGQRSVDELKALKSSGQQFAVNTKDAAVNAYLNMNWRTKRPDLTLLFELVLLIVLAVILYHTWPFLTGRAKPGFSKAQFNRAMKLPETAFSIEELAKVNLEVKALSDYAGYFKNNPYSMANSGIKDLLVSVAILPFLIFFIQFVLPPFVFLYILWFMWRYWPYVFAAGWGWFVAMYSYFTTLAEGKLGCKWYIRFVTGWDCETPDFYEYYSNWKREYIDMPVYYEKLAYVQKYFWAKTEYIEKPWRKYVVLPLERYKIKAEYAKKIYLERSIEVFLKKLRDMYPQYYTMPRDQFYQWLLGNNKQMAHMYQDAMLTKDKLAGRPFRGQTDDGEDCDCPGEDTPVSVVTASLQEQKDDAIHDVSMLVNTTHKLFNGVQRAAELTAPSCENVDKVINNRKSIASSILVTLVVACIVMYVYSSVYGAPVWVMSVLAPTSQYVMRGANVVASGQSYWSLPLLYGGVFVSLMLLVRFY